MAFTENYADFFADFAVNATMGSATFPVIFDRAHIESLGISATQPVAVAKTSDVSSASRGTSITIPVGGTAYKVLDNQPDGTGMSTLILELA